MRADHVEVGLEAAVGDDDGCCIEFGGACGLVRRNLDSARSKLQRAGTRPAQNPTLPLPQVFFEPRQRNVAGISPPGQAEPFSPWRGQHVGLVAAEIDEIDALALEPLHQPAAVLGDGARQILARKALAAGFDLAEQHILVRPYVGEIDVERAVCVARVAEVFFFLALLQDDDALAELRGAVGGDEARDARPDHDHVVLDVRFGHRTGVRIRPRVASRS